MYYFLIYFDKKDKNSIYLIEFGGLFLKKCFGSQFDSEGFPSHCTVKDMGVNFQYSAHE